MNHKWHKFVHTTRFYSTVNQQQQCRHSYAAKQLLR